MPWFIARYPGRVRLVHFTRHPVRFAYSTESHAFTSRTLRDDGYTRDAQLEPTDAGVRYPAYRQRWADDVAPSRSACTSGSRSTPYILELPRLYPDVPYLHMRMEDLTADKPGRWHALLGFLQLPVERLPAHPQRQERVDQFRFLIDRVADPALVQHHPEVMEMARALGYDPLAVNRQAAARRYERSPARRVARNLVRRVLGRYYNPLRRRMVDWQQARRSAGASL